ncbi:RRP15-like protein isoform X1 [Oryzias latipes]|uniref:RRP15-like protein n=2 Tax=Oryzias latipes TaxID=8090 RepID=H2LEL9_ORYLA|nr:RRP15-like protein isoform X1 [Oryzias latipes]
MRTLDSNRKYFVVAFACSQALLFTCSMAVVRIISGDDAISQLEDQQDCDGEICEEEDDVGEENQQEDGEDAGAGWAEAMAKILGKETTVSNSSILLKNKELQKIKAAEREEQLIRKKQLDRKRTWEMMFREKPDLVRDREAERALQRTATRGVVQLFNAVRKHQKTLDQQVKEAGSSERKKAKILSSFSKKDFIGALRRTEEGGRVHGEGRTHGKPEEGAAAEQKPSWSVLSDDFMMGATMKDWDKDSGAEEAEPHSDGGSGDSD